MKKVSMQMIADELNISKNSVSQALRDKPGVSVETKKMVLAKAKELGYEYVEPQKNKVAKNFLLLATPFAFSQISFFGIIIQSIEEVCKHKNCNVTTIPIDNTLLSSSTIPNDWLNYDGIFIISHSNNHFIKRVIDTKIPVVVVDHHDPSFITDTILSKNTDGTFQAIQLLVENNHTRIGFIGDINFSPSYLERFYGYQRSLNHFGLLSDEEIQITQIEETQGDLFNKLKQVKQMPDAWFCVNSGLAFMLNSYLQAAGYTIPDDISIICFDDTEFTRMSVPTITNVATDLDFMGKYAVDTLLHRIKHPKEPVICHQIMPQINLRDSVKIYNK